MRRGTAWTGSGRATGLAGLVLTALVLAGCGDSVSDDARVCAQQWETVFRQHAQLGGLAGAVESASTQSVVMPPDMGSTCSFEEQPDESVRAGKPGTLRLVVTADGVQNGVVFEPTSEQVTRCFDLETNEYGHGQMASVDCPEGEDPAG